MKARIALLVLIALPPLLALGQAIDFHFRNRNNGSLVSSGEKREYLLYVPRSYNPSKPAPLIISLHGAGGWPVQQEDVSQWDGVADAEGLIVVYPAGSANRGPPVWRETDVRFISDLIDRLERSYNIDRDRIYANGLSNGGGMSFFLSCKLSDRIAAVGLVGAALSFPWRECTDRRPVPVIAFHGTADPLTKYHGGRAWMAPDPFPDITRWFATWAKRNGCAPQPVETPVASDVTRREYVRCAENASVVLYTIRGGGHTWPGGRPMAEFFVGATNQNINASRVMWSFFREHPRVQ